MVVGLQGGQGGGGAVLAHDHQHQVVSIAGGKLLDDVGVAGGLLAGLDVFQHQAVLAQLFQALAARQQGYIVAALHQPGSEQAAQWTSAIDEDFHVGLLTILGNWLS